MKTFKIETISGCWTTRKLIDKTEKHLRERIAQGWEIFSVSFGLNIWWMPTAYLTFSKLNEENGGTSRIQQ
jgi:hypothetical protein